ncbi:MAG TPA: glycosyltransferase, partial [Tahibacter sp.]|nr:glycosyltransferase [Tahibacter sp.]
MVGAHVARRGLLLVTTSFPERFDGSEAAGSFVADLATALADELPVSIVAPGREPSTESWRPNVQIYRYFAPVQPLSSLRPYDPRHWGAIRATLRNGAQAVRTAVQDGAIAHLFALWALPSGWWARQVARATGIPYSVWMLGSDVWTLGKIPLVRQLLATTMRDASHRFADGLQLAEDSRAICGRAVEFLPSTRLIEGRRESPLASAPPYRLLFLGRWHPNKGTDLLLDALAALDDDDWSRVASIEIQGGGPLDALVRDKAAALIARGRPVVVGGFLDKAAASLAFLRADWLVIPSRIESIPVV